MAQASSFFENFSYRPRGRPRASVALTLRSGTDDNPAHVNIGRLLDREHDRTLSEHDRSRLAYSTARAGDDDDL
jgi:hypothetical protein